MLVIVARRSPDNKYYLRFDQPGHIQKHVFTIDEKTTVDKDGWFSTTIVSHQLEVRIKIREDKILMNTLDFKNTQYFIFELKELDQWYEPSIN